MISYPLSFFGTGSGTPGMETNWETSSSGYEVTCAVPKEFEGGGLGMSPEDLYLLALQNCFLATFKVFAHYSKLDFKNVEVKSELIVDLNTEKKPIMKKVILRIDLTGATDLKKAQLLVKKALDNGFILQSVKTEIQAETNYL
jgi:organic hydroperoxide reductase OsmC/OhrA